MEEKDKKPEEPEENKLEKLNKNESNSNDKETIKPEIIEKIKKNPVVMKEMIMAFMKSGPSYPPFLNKINSEHITQALGMMDKEIDNECDLKKNGRWFTAGYTLLGTFIFVFLVVYFTVTNNVSLLQEVLRIGGAVVVGGIGGYGISEARKKRDR